MFTTHDTETWPQNLRSNLSILSSEEMNLASLLLSLGQQHLFSTWEKPSKNDELKHQFFRQVKELHESYNVPGGLAAYISNARKLLQSAKDGENPLAGWTPEVPTGINLEPLTAEYDAYEIQGLKEIGTCGFVLVAGGMGERLGYNGIKVELPTETTTGICYLELYCSQILAMQCKYAASGMKLPFAIMVSEDTASKTVALLEANRYFGLEKEQVTIMKQGKVPALINNAADIATISPYVIDSKPHGHGDVHSLMDSTGTANKWRDAGVKWCVFFQDTNGLAFISLPAMIGVSVSLSLDVNSLAIPRYAKQAVGGIAKLVHEDGRQMTINVEYNQLDPLLRATVSLAGDVNDETTGRSIFPGNINHLLFSMDSYTATLKATHGAINEFVNPKYSDDKKTSFKKPTRLECMMQDYPKLLGSESRVGFTLAPAWVCYSPCKNNPVDAAASAAAGVPAGSAYQAESDMYAVYGHILRKLGASVIEAQHRSFLGISASPGPCIVISPTTAIFISDIQCIFPEPSKIHISASSSLIVVGDVVIRSLRLDGALKVVAMKGSQLIVRSGGGPTRLLKNAGRYYHECKADDNTESLGEVINMRGYEIQVREEKVVMCPLTVQNGSGSAAACIDQYIFTGDGEVIHASDFTGGADSDDDDIRDHQLTCFRPRCIVA